VGLRAPADFGGQGMPALVAIAAEEMWCSSNLAFSLAPLLTLGAVEAIHHHASEELKAAYLPRMSRRMDRHHEPDRAASRFRPGPSAPGRPQADGSYWSSAPRSSSPGEHDMAENIVHLVLARLPDAPAGVKGISLFIVPKFLVNADGSWARATTCTASRSNTRWASRQPTAVMNFGDNGGAIGYLVGEPPRAWNTCSP
jgi:acyl-CoA dehydrogenase